MYTCKGVFDFVCTRVSVYLIIKKTITAVMCLMCLPCSIIRLTFKLIRAFFNGIVYCIKRQGAGEEGENLNCTV